MRILLLTQVLPYPPDSGPKVKTWSTIKYLAQKHDVTLGSFVRGDQSADVAHLRAYCDAVHTVPMERGVSRDGWAMICSLLTGQPWMMVRDDRGAMRRLVDRLAADTSFDVVHADQLNMAQYALRVRGTFKVLDAHNALWLLYSRLARTMRPGPKKWLLERDWRLLKRYEGEMVRCFDAVLAVTEEDRASLLDAAGAQRKITVMPIAIDTEQVMPVARQFGANHILHIGTMYWPPNVDGVSWFLDRVYPVIQRHRPDVVLDIVGSRPPECLRALSRRVAGVNVTGYVADPTPYLEQAGIFIVPLRAGGGMRVKILNAWAQGIPVVSTTLGCEGIAVTPGWDILIGDTPAEFAAAVLNLLNDNDVAHQIAERARQRVVEEYDYRMAYRPLDGIYAGAGGKETR